MTDTKSTKKPEPSLRLRFPSEEAFNKVRDAVKAANAKSLNAFIVSVAIDAADIVLNGSTSTPGQLAGKNITRE